MPFNKFFYFNDGIANNNKFKKETGDVSKNNSSHLVMQ